MARSRHSLGKKMMPWYARWFQIRHHLLFVTISISYSVWTSPATWDLYLLLTGICCFCRREKLLGISFVSML
jgi:hypothetical protein